MSEQTDRQDREAPSERPYKERGIEQLRDVISMLAHFIWHRTTRPGDHFWSIPVDQERDWDCILSDAIDELEARRKAAEAAGASVPQEAAATAEWLREQWRLEMYPFKDHDTFDAFYLAASGWDEVRRELAALTAVVARLTGEASSAPQGEPSTTEDSQLPASNP